MKKLVILSVVISFVASCTGQNSNDNQSNKPMMNSEKVVRSEEEWRKILSPEEYTVLREKGTESPYSGKYYKHNEKGVYVCGGCGAELFLSETKFDAHCGWPSFYEASSSGNVEEHTDKSHGMTRTEVVCSKCGGHLGHVFNDGPNPTGLRYCINSVSIDFKEK